MLYIQSITMLTKRFYGYMCQVNCDVSKLVLLIPEMHKTCYAFLLILIITVFMVKGMKQLNEATNDKHLW